jgi:Zn-dependent peptidase ImmA (M78 family)
MLICIGINKFVFSTRTGLIKNKDYKKVYLLASEVLVPMEELTNISFKSLDDIRSYSKTFKVTPSMFLMCLLNAQKISLQNAKLFLEELKKSTKTITTPPNQPSPPQQKKSKT